jgi:hypothetical protein
MLEDELYRPIKYFGYAFVAIGLLGFATLAFCLMDVKYQAVVWAFIGSVSLLHLILGIGILNRKKWGLLIFKAYLNLLYIGFPIGTYLARQTLKYIKDNRLEDLFD